jgi:hypothetical protein
MKPLKATAMDHAHSARLNMFAEVPAGTTLDDVLSPEFWSAHTPRLKRGAIIEVLSEDNALDCDLRVLKVGPTFAHVRLLRCHTEEAERVAQETHSEITVGYGGKQGRWRVLHLGKVVKEGMETKVEAERFAEDFKRDLISVAA